MTGSIIEFIVLLLAHAAAGIYSSTLKYSKKNTYLIWGAWIVLQTVLLWYAEFVLTNKNLQFFAGFALPLIGQYAIFFATTKGKITQRIFTMLTYSIFFCISMTLFTMVKGTFSALHPGLHILIEAVLLFAVVSYFLCYVCPLYRAAAQNVSSGWMLLIYVNIVFLLAVILSSVFPQRLTLFSDRSCITFIFLSVSIMTVYPVIFMSINSMYEAATKREVERQNRLLLTQIEVENMQLAADSQARHDRRHHNLVMLEFANHNDIESIREYLKNLVESESEIWGAKIFCEHMTVNTVLTVYERRAQEMGIPVRISAQVSRDLEILPQDLVIVIANLFENAIHGADKAKSKDKFIEISIRESSKRLLVRVENACKENMVFDEFHYGIGIRSVIATTNKYDGMYDFSADGRVFAAKISLNLE